MKDPPRQLLVVSSLNSAPPLSKSFATLNQEADLFGGRFDPDGGGWVAKSTQLDLTASTSAHSSVDEPGATMAGPSIGPSSQSMK
jgi:hypothetical protein